jgi:hypothetical protein
MCGMCTLSFTNPQNEKSMGARLGDVVATECSRHDLSIFPRMFGSGTAFKQGTGRYLTHDSVEGATHEIVFPAVQISTAAGVRAQ